MNIIDVIRPEHLDKLRKTIIKEINYRLENSEPHTREQALILDIDSAQVLYDLFQIDDFIVERAFLNAMDFMNWVDWYIDKKMENEQ